MYRKSKGRTSTESGSEHVNWIRLKSLVFWDLFITTAVRTSNPTWIRSAQDKAHRRVLVDRVLDLRVAYDMRNLSSS
jgi:hypothetical protein